MEIGPIWAASVAIAAAAGACASIALHEQRAMPTMLALPEMSAAELTMTAEPLARASDQRGGRKSLVVRRAPDGLFYVNLPINGQPVRFVVDTGASVMVLSEADAALAGVYANGAAAAMTTANGSTEMRWAAIRDLRIGDHRLTDVQAAIAQGAHVSLIGQNVLSRLDSVEMIGERLIMR